MSDRIEVGVTTETRKDIKELEARYKAASKDMAELEHPHGRIAAFLDQWVQRNFKTEGGNVGGWKPFAGGGRWKKGNFDPSAKLLQDTGMLRISFRPFADRKDAGIGSDIPYAKPHEKGQGVPKRRMLPMLKEVNKDIRKIYTGHIKEISEKHALGDTSTDA